MRAAPCRRGARVLAPAAAEQAARRRRRGDDRLRPPASSGSPGSAPTGRRRTGRPARAPTRPEPRRCPPRLGLLAPLPERGGAAPRRPPASRRRSRSRPPPAPARGARAGGSTAGSARPAPARLRVAARLTCGSAGSDARAASASAAGTTPSPAGRGGLARAPRRGDRLERGRSERNGRGGGTPARDRDLDERDERPRGDDQHDDEDGAQLGERGADANGDDQRGPDRRRGSDAANAAGGSCGDHTSWPTDQTWRADGRRAPRRGAQRADIGAQLSRLAAEDLDSLQDAQRRVELRRVPVEESNASFTAARS